MSSGPTIAIRSLYEWFWFKLLAIGQSCSHQSCPLSQFLFIIFMDIIYIYTLIHNTSIYMYIYIYIQPRGSGLVSSGLRRCFLQMVFLASSIDDLQQALGLFAAMWETCNWPVVVKRELNQKAESFTGLLLLLTYGHGLYVVSKRMGSRLQTAKISFLRRVVRHAFSYRMRSLDIREKPQLLHFKRSQLTWFGHLVRMLPGHLLGEVFWACTSKKRPLEKADSRYTGLHFSTALVINMDWRVNGCCISNSK